MILLSNHPRVTIGFFGVGIFLTFYYLSFLIKESYRTFKFKKEHKELIKKAQEEIRTRR